MLGHPYIGAEHLLLGLLREEKGLAARVLASFDVTVEEVRAQLPPIAGHSDRVTMGQIPFTRGAQRVLEVALEQALALRHDYIGTEHVLLGLLRQRGGVAVQILTDVGASPDEVWAAVFRELGSTQPPDRSLLDTAEDGDDVRLTVSSFGDGDDERWPWLYDVWPSLVAGAAIFGAGLSVGWLIWG